MKDSNENTADWGEHHEWQWNGHRCHWRHLGEEGQPPLILLHGFATGCGHWRRNAAVLADAGWRVYGLDLLGFGSSSQPVLRLDNRMWARQVHSFLQEVVGEPAVLVGHSLGGLVALSCSVFFPQWVLALIAAPLPDPTLLVLSPSDLRQERTRRPPWRRWLKKWLVVLLCRLLPLEVFVPLVAHSPLLDLAIQSAYRTNVIGDRELHQLIARPARRPGAIRALRSMSIAMALRPLRATAPSLLTRLRQPMLLIWGEDDALVPLEVARQCQRFQACLTIHVIPGVGHCPHDERSQLFNTALVAWLDDLGFRASASMQKEEGARGRVP
jgi:pimeloyl-ACP methyl ester carboxylesterase